MFEDNRNWNGDAVLVKIYESDAESLIAIHYRKPGWLLYMVQRRDYEDHTTLQLIAEVSKTQLHLQFA